MTMDNLDRTAHLIAAVETAHEFLKWVKVYLQSKSDLHIIEITDTINHAAEHLRRSDFSAKHRPHYLWQSLEVKARNLSQTTEYLKPVHALVIERAADAGDMTVEDVERWLEVTARAYANGPAVAPVD